MTNGTGTIQATGALGFGIRADGTATVTNGTGSILATGVGGIAIEANGIAKVDNGGHIAGDTFAIEANTVNVNSNAGTIEALGTATVTTRLPRSPPSPMPP